MIVRDVLPNIDQPMDQNQDQEKDKGQDLGAIDENGKPQECAITRELRRQLDLGLITLPPRPSWKTAPYLWEEDEQYETGLSREEVQHWREKLIGKRLLMSSRGRADALDEIWYWVREAHKELEEARHSGSQEDVKRAQAILDEQLEAERLAPLMSPELDIHWYEMPAKWVIAGQGTDDVDRDRITVFVDDTDGFRRYGHGIITNVGRL